MARYKKRPFISNLHDFLHPFEARARHEEEERRAREGREQAGRRAESRTHRELIKLCRQGCYYVFDDLTTLHAGNIDHLVVGPEGLTIVESKANSGTIEAVKTGRESFSLRIGGRPLHRSLVNQLRSQMWDLCERAGMKTSPSDTYGMNWIVCFPNGELGQGFPPHVRAHIATLDDLSMKVRAGERLIDERTVHNVASAVSSIYERPPSAAPARRL